jgi:hypothetical protein
LFWEGNVVKKNLLSFLPIAVVLTLVAGSVGAASGEAAPKDMAQKIVHLRAEVEMLNSEIEADKQESKAKLKSLYLQKAELEAEIQRELMRIKQLKKQMAEMRKQISDSSVGREELMRVVQTHIDHLLVHVKESLPFKTQQRVSELEKLKKSLQLKEASPHKVAGKLWSFVEDEFRLSREIGLHRQVISIEGKEQLVDVAKVGMVYMYYRTPDFKYGYAYQSLSGWQFAPFKSSGNQKLAAVVFDNFKKRIRVGEFELPSELPISGDARGE